MALAGIDEVALGRNPSAPMQRVGVGRRPTALAPAPTDGMLWSRTRSMTPCRSSTSPPASARLDPASVPRSRPTWPARRAPVFDARLSHDGWMSCNSCHTDGHTNGRLTDTQGDDSYGAPKRVPSLLGVGARTVPWMWTGAIDRLEDQVRKSIETTMRGPTLRSTSRSPDRVPPHARPAPSAAVSGYLRGRPRRGLHDAAMHQVPRPARLHHPRAKRMSG